MLKTIKINKTVKSKSKQIKSPVVTGGLVVPLPTGHRQDTIRPSAIKSFAGCELKYKFEYVDKLFKPKEALFQGIIFDEACNAVAKTILHEPKEVIYKEIGLDGLVNIAVNAAEDSYTNQVNEYISKNIVPKWLKSKKEYMHLVNSYIFTDFIQYLLLHGVESVQKTVSFDWVYEPTGELLTVEGMLDIKSDIIIDVKTSSKSPIQRKGDELGGYVKDNGKEVFYAKISPEYEIQAACYMRAEKVDEMAFYYFIKTKEPKAEIVKIKNSSKLQKLLDVYLTRYYEAHISGKFLPNTYYEWCGSCDFRGKQCEFTEHRRVNV